MSKKQTLSPNIDRVEGNIVYRKKCNCKKIVQSKPSGEYNTTYCESCHEIISYESNQYIDKSIKKEKPTKKERIEKQKAKDANHINLKTDRESLKSDIDIKNEYRVESIDKKMTHEWLEHKHYAKRVPPMMHTFGLYDKQNTLQGVCTFGMPSRNLNSGKGVFDDKVEVDTLELNRLCVNDGLPKNTLSYFVSKCLLMLPKPICIVSYADSNANHHGYIYQATNWVYAGLSEPGKVFYDSNTGKTVHQRTLSSRYGNADSKKLPDNIYSVDEEGGKYRYFQFLGNKREVKIMRSNLKYEVLPYPKGNNERYDSSYKIKTTQMSLF